MSYDDAGKFRAGKLALALEERGFEMVYDSDTVLAEGHESGYIFSVREKEEGLEAIMSIGAENSGDDYSQLPSLEESRKVAGKPSKIDMKFNGNRYFLTADLTDPEHVDEMLGAYEGLSDSDIV